MLASPEPPRAGEDRFFGREGELLDLQSAVVDSAVRTVTLLGLAGVGKTRLALELVRRMECTAWFVEVAIGSSASVLLADLGRVVTGRSGTEAQVLGALQAVAERAPCVVIADNAESALEACADLVRQLANVPGVTVLVTSRVALGSDGELVCAVGPLETSETSSEPSAVMLFLDRAGLDSSTLCDDSAQIAHEIVASLDGLPLAIELAAAQVPLLGLRGLRERLARKFEILESFDRGYPDRHCTLRAAMDSSWQTLSAWEREALGYLSTFQGGFELEAAEAVLPRVDGPSAMEVVRSLSRWSLVRAEGDAEKRKRFVMLTSVRDYVVGHVAEDLHRIRMAHATYYHAEVCARIDIDATPTPDAIEWLHNERGNLQVAIEAFLGAPVESGPRAIEIALRMQELWRQSGPYQDYLSLLNRGIVRLGAEEHSELLARAQVARGRFLGYCGQLEASAEALRTALALAESCGFPALEARACLALTTTLTLRGELDDAIEVARRAIALFETTDDQAGLGRAHEALGIALADHGQLDAATEALERARRCYLQMGDVREQATVSTNLAILRLGSGKLGEAEALQSFALSVFEQQDDPCQIGIAKGNLGLLYHLRGDLDRSRDFFQEGVEELRRAGSAPVLGIALAALASVLADSDRLGDSLATLEEAERSAGSDAGAYVDQLRALCRGHYLLALARQAQKDGALDLAQGYREEVQQELRRTESSPFRSSPDIAISVRLLRRVFDAGQGSAVPTLHLASDGSWFAVGENPREILHRRQALRGILSLLAERHGSTVGGVSADELIAAGWPAERINKISARNRLYVTLARLRKLGLDRYLHSGAAGYSLDPELRIERVR